MNPVQIIGRKRDGRELTSDEIAFFVRGFAAGRIPNYQMSALAMAIYFKGMNATETAKLSEELVASGKRIQWSKTIECDSSPRLEMAVVGGQKLSVSALQQDDDDFGGSELDARDTVDLGDNLPASLTLMLDGSEKFASEPAPSLSGRDTVDLEGLGTHPIEPSPILGAVVDKHSMGGLGDKTSLVLTPLLACCGLRVPMISGRGMGASAGTLDKLESIPGFRTDLSLDEIREITQRVGCVITGATSDVAPADRKLYALREVTGTVTSIPLVTASVVSRKLAEGLDAVLFDVKWGSGALMKTLPTARKLAESLVETGRRTGIKSAAVLTNMDQPLGRMIGNTVEIEEALDTLAGKGPANLWAVTSDLAVNLLLVTQCASNESTARQVIQDHISSGRALEKFREMVTAQGGNLDAIRSRSVFQFEIRSARAGYVAKINMEALEYAIIEMGGGRRVLSDSVDHSVGLEMLIKIGEKVAVGQPLVRIFCPQTQEASIKALVRTAVLIRSQPVEGPVLVSERIGW